VIKEDAKAKADVYLANQGKGAVLAEDDLGEIADLHRCAEFCNAHTARTTVLNLSFADRQVLSRRGSRPREACSIPRLFDAMPSPR
jgi:hypothetical protein